MFGILIGTACLVGLVCVLRRGPGWRGGGCGSGRRHHHDCGERHRSRGWLWWLFERLDTSPGQERAIREALEELRAAAGEMKSELRHGRNAVADVLRSDSVDETQLGELFARHDDRITELRKAFVGAVQRVHDALDEGQRSRLAELLSSSRDFGWGGPYRSWGR